MGFCLFNNAAIAARAYQSVFGGRVLSGRTSTIITATVPKPLPDGGLSYFSTHAFPLIPAPAFGSYRLRGDFIERSVAGEGVSTETFVMVWEAMLPMVARAVWPEPPDR